MTVEHDPAKTAPAEGPDGLAIPTWQKIAAVAFVIVWGAIIGLWHDRATADFIPLDGSRVAPNLVASFILFSLGTIAAAIIWPPTRLAMHAFADRKLAPIHEHLAVHRRHLEEGAERQELILKQHAHMIANTDGIPNIHEDGTDLTTIPEHLMTTTTSTPAPKYGRGLRPFDPVKHERFPSATALGFSWPAVSYPVDRSAGITDLGMGGNGPDPTLTIQGGPFGNCGPNAVPKNADFVTAKLLGLAYAEMTSDQITTLYFIYQAELAGIPWRPPASPGWTPPDGLDNGVDLGDWLLWLFSHDINGNPAAPGRGLVDGFVKLDPSHMDAALQLGFAVVIGVTLTDNADNEFPGVWVVSPTEQPDPNDGHAIIRLGCESPTGNRKYGTWGGIQQGTAEWETACLQQAFAVFTVDQATAAGFPVAATVGILQSLGGTEIAAPGPSPVPSAPPAVTPPPPNGDTWIRELETLGHGFITEMVRLVESHGGKIPEWTGARPTAEVAEEAGL